MPKNIYRIIGESIAILGVVLSLIFVGLELRQSTIASRAYAFQALGIATSNIWFQLSSNPELNEIFYTVLNDPESGFSSLSEPEKHLFLSHNIGALRLYESVYLQVEQGLLEPEALETLGWDGFKEKGLPQIWAEAKFYVDPAFANYLETNMDL